MTKAEQQQDFIIKLMCELDVIEGKMNDEDLHHIRHVYFAMIVELVDFCARARLINRRQEMQLREKYIDK